MTASVSRASHSLLQASWICRTCRNAATTGSGFDSSSSLSKVRVLINGISWTRQGCTRFYSSTQRTSRKGSNLPGRDVAVKTRFAPSPTGYLHIGGLRTALFSYLLARRCGGKFVLRIEDTDQKRRISDAEERLIEDLQWAGLQWDEGPTVGGDFGPYRQSERTPIYQTHAQQLLENGTAYRCFCTPQSGRDAKAAYVTSGCYQSCSSLSSDESRERAEKSRELFTVRLHPPPDAHKRVYHDLTYKRIQRRKRSPSASLEPSEDEAGAPAADTVLMKSDGTPTYHFANIVDDHLMQITHVIRGEEWLPSTPLHFDIYSAFGWTPPQFAHVGLLVDENKAKLSKRNANMILDVRSMRETHGILPATLNNFLVLLGWSNPSKNDVMDMADMSQNFDLKFTTGNSMVQMEKLWFLQKHHFARLSHEAQSRGTVEPIREVLDKIVAEVKRQYPSFMAPTVFASERSVADSLEGYCAELLLADGKSYQTPGQYVNRNCYFFQRPSTPDETPSLSAADAEARQTLHSITTRLFTDVDLTQPYDEPFVTLLLQDTRLTSAERLYQSSPSYSNRRVVTLERKYHAAIVQQTWLAALKLFMSSQHNTAEHRIQIPFLQETPAPKPFATYLLQQQGTPATSAEQIATVVKIYQDLNRGLMRYLRARLCGGQPGPGMSMTMAILGEEECCARLGIERPSH